MTVAAGVGLVAVAVLGPLQAAAVVIVPVVAVAARLARNGRAAARVDVALAVDLMASCLLAGATTPDAAAAAASVAAPTTAAALATVSADLRTGRDPAAAWADAATSAPELIDVARACGRTAVSGAAVAAELRRLADRDRARRRARRHRDVQRAATWLVLPLGLCFLPAFVLVGVAPLVLAAVPQLTR